MNLCVFGCKLTVLCDKLNQKSHSLFANDLFDGECPHGDLFRTPRKGNTSRQDYVLNDNFEFENRQVMMVLPILGAVDQTIYASK